VKRIDSAAFSAAAADAADRFSGNVNSVLSGPTPAASVKTVLKPAPASYETVNSSSGVSPRPP
jgi:hypothetical protein